MKLILTHEVDNLGAPGDIVDVKDGYGRNYLLPRGLGIRWTKGGEKQIETIKKARQVREVRDLGHAEEIKSQLEQLRVDVKTQAGETGRLFGAVTVADITEAVKAAGGPDIDKRKVVVTEPVKSLGTHTVSVRIHDEVTASLELNVIPA